MIQNQLISQHGVKGIGEDIGQIKAAKEIRNYYNCTGNVDAFLVGKDILEYILNQPGCSGIKIYNAQYDDGSSTLIYLGVDSKGVDIVKYSSVTVSGNIEENDAIIANRPIRYDRTRGSELGDEEFWWEF